MQIWALVIINSILNNFQINKFNKSKRNSDAENSQNKILRNRYFYTIYVEILNRQFGLLDLRGNDINYIVEVGSSGGITKQFNNDINTTDIRSALHLNLVMDGQNFCFKNNSLRGLIGKDVLHHFPDIELHFAELQRCLAPGAKAVYAEPNWNIFSKFIYRFFHPEPWIENQIEWKFQSNNPMYSNQALPYLIFKRDIKKFASLYPDLKVRILNDYGFSFSYLLSRGVHGKGLIPEKLLLHVLNFERKFKFIFKHFDLIRFIIIEKSF